MSASGGDSILEPFSRRGEASWGFAETGRQPQPFPNVPDRAVGHTWTHPANFPPNYRASPATGVQHGAQRRPGRHLTRLSRSPAKRTGRAHGVPGGEGGEGAKGFVRERCGLAWNLQSPRPAPRTHEPRQREGCAGEGSCAGGEVSGWGGRETACTAPHGTPKATS
jgi:hypothetical protein